MAASDSKSTAATYLATLIAAFLAQYDGYSISTSEQHSEPSRWDGGKMTLQVNITCPTGEPPLTPEQVEAREAARAAARKAN